MNVEQTNIGKYLKNTFGVTEYYLKDKCYFESSEDLWLEVI